MYVWIAFRITKYEVSQIFILLYDNRFFLCKITQYLKFYHSGYPFTKAPVCVYYFAANFLEMSVYQHNYISVFPTSGGRFS